jgi:two-component system response regulator YesN
MSTGGVRLFKKLMISYIVMLLLPILVASYVYRDVVQIIEDEAQQSNMNALLQTRDMLDMRFSEIQSIANQLAIHPSVTSLLSYSPFQQGDRDYIHVYQSFSQLPKFSLTNQFVDNYYVYFRNSDISLSANGVYANLQELHSTVFSHVEESEFDNMMTTRHLSPTLFDLMSRKDPNKISIVYVQTFPYYSKSGGGNVAVLFNHAKIQQLLRQTKIGDRGLAFIMDEHGTMVTAAYGKQVDDFLAEAGSEALVKLRQLSDDQDYIVSEVTSNEARWTYVSIVPRSAVLDKVNYIKRITLIILLSIMIVGLLVAFVLSYQNSKPLSDLIRRFRLLLKPDQLTFKSGSEFEFLNQTLLQLSHDREKLTQELYSYRPIMVSTLFRRLLEGVSDYEETVRLLNHCEIKVEQGGIQVIIVSIQKLDYLVYQDWLSEIDEAKLVVKQIYRQTITESQLYIYEPDSTKLVVILFGREVARSAFQGQLRTTAQVLMRHIGGKFHTLFAIGDHYADIRNGHDSYKEACIALDSSSFSGGHWIAYRDLPVRNTSFIFPIETEVRLVRLVKSGDVEGVKKITEQLRHDHFVNQYLTAAGAEQLIQVMKAAIQRGVGALSNDELQQTLDEMNGAQHFEGVVHGIHALAAIMYFAQQKQKGAEKREINERLRLYLQENYADDSLSIAKAAEAFDMSESSFYLFYKEHTGMTFASSVEKLRIKAACSLLQDETKQGERRTIKEVAAMVGYSNEQTFRRAFKKVIGCLPVDYRSDADGFK